MNYRANLDGFRAPDRFHAARLLRRPAGNLRAGGRRVQRRGLRAGAQGGVMKLYMFEHCSLCFRVRMMAALKGLHVAGKHRARRRQRHHDRPRRQARDPDPGERRWQPDARKHGHGRAISSASGRRSWSAPQRKEIAAWADATVLKTAPLTMPRYPAARPARIRHAGRARRTTPRASSRPMAISPSCAVTRARRSKPLCRSSTSSTPSSKARRRSTARCRSTTSACCRCCVRPRWSKA